jgi:hypothetical protein
MGQIHIKLDRGERAREAHSYLVGQLTDPPAGYTGEKYYSMYWWALMELSREMQPPPFSFQTPDALKEWGGR